MAKEAVLCKETPELVTDIGPWRPGCINRMAPGIFKIASSDIHLTPESLWLTAFANL